MRHAGFNSNLLFLLLECRDRLCLSSATVFVFSVFKREAWRKNSLSCWILCHTAREYNYNKRLFLLQWKILRGCACRCAFVCCYGCKCVRFDTREQETEEDWENFVLPSNKNSKTPNFYPPGRVIHIVKTVSALTWVWFVFIWTVR